MHSLLDPILTQARGCVNIGSCVVRLMCCEREVNATAITHEPTTYLRIQFVFKMYGNLILIIK